MKLITSLLFTILMLSAGYQLEAQQNGRPGGGPPAKTVLKGQVIDADTGEGLEFATISLHSVKDDRVVGGGLTEEGGHFSFDVRGKQLYAMVEFISYESVRVDDITLEKGTTEFDMGEIHISPDAVLLEDVEIVAERSETTFSLDKKVFTVGKDLANRGGNAEDVLNNVPSLDVDIDGNVTLRGSEGVRILIDGRPSSLVGVDDGGGLSSLPSNLIEKIEVITNPSARYDAEGMAGIVNIVLKKDTGHGFNAAIDLSAGLPANGGVSANLNYRKGALNWFVNYGVNYRTGPGGGNSIQDRSTIGINTSDVSRQITTLDRNINRSGINNSIRFGADYHLSDKEQITGSFNYKIGDDDNSSDLLYRDYSEEFGEFGFSPLWQDTENESFFDFQGFEEALPQNLLETTTFRTDDEIEKETALQYNLNYSKEFSSREHKLSANISYQDRNESEDNIFTENLENAFSSTSSDIDQRASTDESSRTTEVQLDYVHPLGKDHKWEGGLKGSFRDINTEYIVQEKDLDGNFFSLPGLDLSLIHI